MEALHSSSPASSIAAAAAAQELRPFHARACGGMAAAEQNDPHLRGRCRRGHAGGVLRCRTPLSALLSGRGRRRPQGGGDARGGGAGQIPGQAVALRVVGGRGVRYYLPKRREVQNSHLTPKATKEIGGRTASSIQFFLVIVFILCCSVKLPHL